MAELNPGSIPIGDHETDWFRVMAAASGSSMRVKIASILSAYIREHKDEYTQIVSYTAAKHGLSFDECFHKMRNGKHLGDPLDYYVVEPGSEDPTPSA